MATEPRSSRPPANACCLPQLSCRTTRSTRAAAEGVDHITTSGTIPTLSALWRWLQNQFDCIDLSDNNVVRLDGFPRLERLSMLIATNNRIASIAPALESAPLILIVRHAVLPGRATWVPQLSSPGASS